MILVRGGSKFYTVSCPGWRCHPAILVHAGATLAAMDPGRLWMTLGSGQPFDEGIAGVGQPAETERSARLLECVEAIRASWAGETVTHRGRILVEAATFYSRPEEPPLVIGAAVSPETARWRGGRVGALITVGGADRDSAARSGRGAWTRSWPAFVASQTESFTDAGLNPGWSSFKDEADSACDLRRETHP